MRRGGRASSSTLPARLRDIAAAVDPALQLRDIRTAATIEEQGQQGVRYLGFGIGIVTLSVLLLSAAGIYAMMSFTVARRRREIGIRTALGADARRVLSGVFGRAAAQIGAGTAAGLLLTVALDRVTGGDLLTGSRLLLLPAVAGCMLLVGLLAALGPARRGLAVQPTEALREE